MHQELKLKISMMINNDSLVPLYFRCEPQEVDFELDESKCVPAVLAFYVNENHVEIRHSHMVSRPSINAIAAGAPVMFRLHPATYGSQLTSLKYCDSLKQYLYGLSDAVKHGDEIALRSYMRLVQSSLDNMTRANVFHAKDLASCPDLIKRFNNTGSITSLVKEIHSGLINKHFIIGDLSAEVEMAIKNAINNKSHCHGVNRSEIDQAAEIYTGNVVPLREQEISPPKERAILFDAKVDFNLILSLYMFAIVFLYLATFVLITSQSIPLVVLGYVCLVSAYVLGLLLTKEYKNRRANYPSIRFDAHRRHAFQKTIKMR